MATTNLNSLNASDKNRSIDASCDCLSSFNLVSYNMHGFNQGVTMLKCICSSNHYSAILLQEHWLNTDQLNKFEYFSNEYNIYGKSAMDSVTCSKILRGRPFGGVCTLINKKLCSNFASINCIACADRYVIIQFDNLILINVYLPCCKNFEDREVLCSVFSCISNDISDLSYSYAILGGDINCNITKRSEISDIINAYIINMGLVLSTNLNPAFNDIEYTFSVPARNAFSVIDHFFISSNFKACDLLSLETIDHVDNFSDHLPLKLKLQFDSKQLYSNLTMPSTGKNVEDVINNLCFDWQNSTKDKYYEFTRLELFNLNKTFCGVNVLDLQVTRPDFFTQSGINDLYRNVVHVLINSSLKSIATKNTKEFKKHWWDAPLKQEKLDSLFHFNNWKDAGKPKEGFLFEAKQASHSKYNTAIYNNKSNSKIKLNKKLESNLLNVNNNKFWR